MSDEIFERLTKVAQDAVVQVKVKNALNPCLWLCALIVIPALVLAYFSTGSMQTALLVLAFIPVVFFCVAYSYFMVVDRDKLQSESFQLRKMALALIEKKGTDIPISKASVEVISDPDPSASKLSRAEKLK